MQFLKKIFNTDVDSIDYESWKEDLVNGSIILFIAGGFNSLLVQTTTMSPYSHIGMIIKTDRFKNQEGSADDGLYLWHSVNGIIPGFLDMITKSEKTGPQLNNLRGLLGKCSAIFHVRKLIIPNELKKPNKVQISFDILRSHVKYNMDISNDDSKLLKFMKIAVEKPFELHTTELIKSAFHFFNMKPQDNHDSFFCSELIADSYKSVGILPIYVNGSDYLPKDFGHMSQHLKKYEKENQNTDKPSIEITGCKLLKIKNLIF